MFSAEICCFFIYRDCTHGSRKSTVCRQSFYPPPIRIVKRYIAEHYSEDISLSDAAKIVNLSPVYLSRLFKKEEGINFLDYLNQYRIDISKNLLKDVKHNILETASLSGFGSTKYFSKIFKKTVGITPSEYRKRHLGTNGGEK
ncbi:MAG: helix-turn-helix transcriptional regulator [Clostridiales bacterium]|nr:helix-turn-helix transcriptional regulator [Clostridiales bacterium]